jgi:hypothetical protein
MAAFLRRTTLDDQAVRRCLLPYGGAMRFQLVTRPGQPDFLDLPWRRPLEAWHSERLVEVASGIHRHVVRFVNYDGALYALKELPERIAEREYRLLRHLAEVGVPVVEAVGIVSDRGRERVTDEHGRVEMVDMEAVLITRHLEFSLPYRTLFTGRGMPDLREKLLDALAQLLVRLHLANFFWGDCSLSNTLFRRDAGALAAYLVDAETGELRTQFANRMRLYDLDVAQENIAGELLDLQAEQGVLSEQEAVDTALGLRQRYEYLWSELTREEVFGPDERYKIEARLRRLNDLGFDVEEIELLTDGDGYRLRVQTHVVEPGHHRRQLLSMTGLDVQENQARRLLNDIAGYRAELERRTKKPLPEAVVAYRWLKEVFEPTIAAIPPELRGKLEPAELYHEILEHRWFLSERTGRDVGLSDAVKAYSDEVLRFVPDEQRVLLDAEAGLDPLEESGVG